MSDPQVSPATDEVSHEEESSALFAQLILQQSNLAMMLLGKVPHPQTGKTIVDVDAARMFIDQLEMLEAKTQGNLTKDEQQLLKSSLMSLHMAFVDTIKSAPTPAESQTPPPASPSPAAETPGTAEPPATNPDAADESKKKFSKKY